MDILEFDGHEVQGWVSHIQYLRARGNIDTVIIEMVLSESLNTRPSSDDAVVVVGDYSGILRGEVRGYVSRVNYDASLNKSSLKKYMYGSPEGKSYELHLEINIDNNAGRESVVTQPIPGRIEETSEITNTSEQWMEAYFDGADRNLLEELETNELEGSVNRLESVE